MQLSSIPKKIAAIFAASAPGTAINTVPLTQAGTTQPGQASFDVGFPAVTMQPAASGGINPYGQDFNGMFNPVTAVQQWQCAGGGFPYDVGFSSTIGGYPKYARVQKADGTGYWVSTVDNNTSNPDTGGAGWTDGAMLSYAADTGTANTYVVNYSPAITALVDGMELRFLAKNANTGASTINVNGLGAKTIYGNAYAALQGGEIIANGECKTVWNATLSGFVLVGNAGGAAQIPAGSYGTTPPSSDNSTKVITSAWALLGFAVSLNQNGYLKFPSWLGGLIIQWGFIAQASLPTGYSPATATFPMTYPNNVYTVVSLPTAPAGFSNITGYPSSQTTSQFTQNFTNGAGGPASIGALWFSVGR